MTSEYISKIANTIKYAAIVAGLASMLTTGCKDTTSIEREYDKNSSHISQESSSHKKDRKKGRTLDQEVEDTHSNEDFTTGCGYPDECSNEYIGRITKVCENSRAHCNGKSDTDHELIIGIKNNEAYLRKSSPSYIDYNTVRFSGLEHRFRNLEGKEYTNAFFVVTGKDENGECQEYTLKIPKNGRVELPSLQNRLIKLLVPKEDGDYYQVASLAKAPKSGNGRGRKICDEGKGTKCAPVTVNVYCKGNCKDQKDKDQTENNNQIDENKQKENPVDKNRKPVQKENPTKSIDKQTLPSLEAGIYNTKVFDWKNLFSDYNLTSPPEVIYLKICNDINVQQECTTNENGPIVMGILKDSENQEESKYGINLIGKKVYFPKVPYIITEFKEKNSDSDDKKIKYNGIQGNVKKSGK